MCRKPKEIRIPKISTDLAYLCGLLAGDGYIGIRTHKSEYVVNCGGNPNDEVEFYEEIVSPLFMKLFNIKVKPKLLGKTYGFNIWSKKLVFFLLKDVGLNKSPKHNLDFPSIFYKEKKLALSFIKGVADTDFSFKLRQHYPVISGSSKSKIFIEKICKILDKHHFNFYTSFGYKIPDGRLKKGYSIINRVDLNGHFNFLNWLKVIGTNQPKNIKKISKWFELNANNTRVKKLIKEVAERGFEPPTFTQATTLSGCPKQKAL